MSWFGVFLFFSRIQFPYVSYNFLTLFSCTSSYFQNVPPAILLRFLREHRSEWADSSIDAYSAAAVKAGPCSLPGTRAGSYGGQVILPLAHTIEHEEASDLFLEFLTNNIIFLFT